MAAQGVEGVHQYHSEEELNPHSTLSQRTDLFLYHGNKGSEETDLYAVAAHHLEETGVRPERRRVNFPAKVRCKGLRDEILTGNPGAVFQDAVQEILSFRFRIPHFT